MSLSPINATTTAANPIDATGTILEYAVCTIVSGVLTPGTWKQVANLLDLKPHKMTAPEKDSTTHSTTGGVRTNTAKMGKSGETEYTLLYDKTAYGMLAALWRNSLVMWRVTLNDAATDAVQGTLMEYGLGTPLDGDATIECKVTHSGVPTLVTT